MIDAAVLALAEAIHDEDDLCNAAQVTPFEECATREWDIETAGRVLMALAQEDWRLVHQPAFVAGLFE